MSISHAVPPPLPNSATSQGIVGVATPVLDEPPSASLLPPPTAASRAAATAGASPDAAQAPAEEPESEDNGAANVSRRLLHMSASCGVSLCAHFTLILVLGLLTIPAVVRSKVHVLETSVTEQRPIEEVVHRLDENLKPAISVNAVVATSGGGTVQGVQGAIAAVTQPPKMNTKLSEQATALKVDVGAVNVFTTSGEQFAADAPTGTLGEAMGYAEGYGDAMDALTREILNRLARNKVLVVWLFDQSLSMKDDQKEIRDRIEKVYDELGLSTATKGDALWTAVTSYGKGFAVHTPRPTNLIDDIKAAIDAVPVDESGEEMMCTAVTQAVGNFRQFAGGGRQMMFVLATDESGNQNDNQTALEPAIATCKEARASVYCIGREAVFSYPYAHMNWTVTLPAVGGGTVSRDYVVKVDRGPESPYVELLQTEGFDIRTDAHPSGFGPYEQVRLCRETGGMFFLLPSPESKLFRRDMTQFDFEIMRPYIPDLRSRTVYAEERDYNALRSLIWKVINDLNPYKPEIARYINLRQTFAPDVGPRASQIDLELNKAKVYITYLDAAEKAMREARRNRDREKSPRWRAHYDLILAQLIAYKARVYEYGAYLTAFKQNPKAIDPPTPTRVLRDWRMRERSQTISGALIQPYVDESSQLFREIMKEYAGTPWATRAEFELNRGYGVDLFPRYVNPQAGGGGRRPVTPFRPPTI